MITSDDIIWNASLEEHPARSAAQRSFSAVAKGDLDEWLTVYAEDAVIEDPVGPSMFDPEGKGHHGHEGIRAFWKLAIEPIETFQFTINESFANGNATASLGKIKTTFPDGSFTVTDLITVHVVNDEGRVVSMKAYWEAERTMATFTPAP
ncbi:nuclear transport factor 2 family protein [Nocardioides sp.]|uniref:nuclear transport factor 2 family protein n=1 Tax=Nocardioides sp. TaxID=35761 RepID=UPI003566D3B4